MDEDDDVSLALWTAPTEEDTEPPERKGPKWVKGVDMEKQGAQRKQHAAVLREKKKEALLKERRADMEEKQASAEGVEGSQEPEKAEQQSSRTTTENGEWTVGDKVWIKDTVQGEERVEEGVIANVHQSGKSVKAAQRDGKTTRWIRPQEWRNNIVKRVDNETRPECIPAKPQDANEEETTEANGEQEVAVPDKPNEDRV